jgi:hypothetical protein
MAGAAGAMVFLGDAPPQFMTSDVLSANALARIIAVARRAEPLSSSTPIRKL